MLKMTHDDIYGCHQNDNQAVGMRKVHLAVSNDFIVSFVFPKLEVHRTSYFRTCMYFCGIETIYFYSCLTINRLMFQVYAVNNFGKGPAGVKKFTLGKGFF